jgi:hypothetical protein
VRRYLALAVVAFIGFLILLAEIGRLQEDVEAQVDKQRYFNAHQ